MSRTKEFRSKLKVRKSSEKRSFKRVILKLSWFALISFLVFIIGLICLWPTYYFAEDPINDKAGTVVWIILAGLLLMALLSGILLLTKKRQKRTVIRWTRRSIVLLLPLVAITGLISIAIVDAEFNRKPSEASPKTNTEAVRGNNNYIEGLVFSPEELLKYTNNERVSANLSGLSLNSKLNGSADAKCKDMVANNYWSHKDKSGRDPWHFFEASGYAYNNAGENLAYGYLNEQETVNGWMISPTHKANLLDDKFSEVGYGICIGENFVNTGKHIIVVQHLASPQSSRSKNTNSGGSTYNAGVCTKIPIPYKTKYEYVSYLYEDERNEYGGTDGYTETCTPDSFGYKIPDFTIQPNDKTVYIGTKKRGPSQAELDAAARQKEAERQSRIAACIKYIQSVSPGSAYYQCYNIN